MVNDCERLTAEALPKEEMPGELRVSAAWCRGKDKREQKEKKRPFPGSFGG
jgi:hypothetical protein